MLERVMAKTNQERAKQLEKIKKKALGGLLLKKKKRLSFLHLNEQHNVLCVGICFLQRNRTHTRKTVGVRADGIFSYCGN